MKGPHGYQDSSVESELEAAFQRAQSILGRNPQLAEVDIGLSVVYRPCELQDLEEVSQRFGLRLSVHPSGVVMVRRSVAEQTMQLEAPVDRLTTVAGFEIDQLANSLRRGRSGVYRHLPHWHTGFEGLSEGTR